MKVYIEESLRLLKKPVEIYYYEPYKTLSTKLVLCDRDACGACACSGKKQVDRINIDDLVAKYEKNIARMDNAKSHL